MTFPDQTRPSLLVTAHFGGSQIAFLALAAGVATATSYTVHPDLAVISRDLGATLAATSMAAGSPIFGYLIGLALLVPLVDRMAARTVVSAQLAGLAVSLCVAASASDLPVFAVGLVVSGLCASTGAQMSTLAGKHSNPARRGAALGAVTAGISAGVVFGRLAGGALSDAAGWRAMLLIVACACLACAIGAWLLLPKASPRAVGSYAEMLRTLPSLLIRHPPLARAALAGALWFFAFSLVWMSLSIALAQPPLNLSATVVGLYSLAGVAGMIVTGIAGRAADRIGSRPVVLGGLVLALGCILVMAPSLAIAPVILIGLALFDVGLFAAQVANQRNVLGVDPASPARFNSVYMVVYFIGGTAGAAAGGPIVAASGWPAASMTAALAITVAAALVLTGRRPTSGS